MYALQWKQPGRRAGLTRNGHKAPSLLQTISSPNNRNSIRPRTSQPATGEKMTPATEDLSEEGIYALPKDESDTSSDEEDPRAADIKPTQFRRLGSREPDAKTQTAKEGSALDNKRKSSLASVRTNAQSSTIKTRSSRQAPLGSSKRKDGENGVELGTGMIDQFGRITTKKTKNGRTYGSGRQKSNTRLPHLKPPNESPQAKKFKYPEILDPSSDLESDKNTPSKPTLKKVDTTEFDSSPEKGIAGTPPGAALQKFDTTEFDSPERPFADSPLKLTFKGVDSSGFESSSEESKTTLVELKKFGVQPGLPLKTSVLPGEELPLTQLPTFKRYAIEGELAHKAQDIIGHHTNISDLASTQFDEDEGNSTAQLGRCPMCGKPVDPEELRRRGEMNIRQQEKFCRDHQKNDAKENWSLKGYPEIDWDILDARISQHHAFIKELVNGAESHYRTKLDNTVKAGKDRTLLKSETSLTPGYYGTRGLRAISENIMLEFTPLLKKRVVKDRLMAARGVTGFVQYVLVPEVTVLLIMEDMNIMIDEARTVMKDSIGMGELIHEEIRDVVVRRVEDTDDEDGREESEEYN